MTPLDTYSWSSASSIFIASKLAPPTPTMMMDMGSLEAWMMACLVASMSEIAPSVNIRSTKYCYNREGEKNGRGYCHVISHVSNSVTAVEKIADKTCLAKIYQFYLNFNIFLCFSSKLCHMRYYGGKVCGSPQLDRTYSTMVGLHHTVYPRAVGVGGVPIQGKLMGDLAINLSTKPKGRK